MIEVRYVCGPTALTCTCTGSRRVRGGRPRAFVPRCYGLFVEGRQAEDCRIRRDNLLFVSLGGCRIGGANWICRLLRGSHTMQRVQLSKGYPRRQKALQQTAGFDGQVGAMQACTRTDILSTFLPHTC